MKPGARLAFVCWRAVAENPWAKVPLDAAIAEVGPPAPQAPGAPGPFAFADASRVRAILAAAGFESVDVRPFDARVRYGDAPDDAAKYLVAMGPASRLLASHDDATVARAVLRTRASLAPFASAQGVRVPGATWIVTATR